MSIHLFCQTSLIFAATLMRPHTHTACMSTSHSYSTSHTAAGLLVSTYYYMTHTHTAAGLLLSTYYHMTTRVSAYYYRPRGVDCAFVPPPPPPPTLPAPASFLSYSLILCPVFSASFLRRESADTCASSLRVDDSIKLIHSFII